MKKSDSQRVGELAESEVEAVLRNGGCATSKIISDYGEDLFVDVPHRGHLVGARVLLQVKGTRKPITFQNDRPVLGRIETNLLRKWRGTVVPVAAILWNVRDRTGFFAFLNRPDGPANKIRENQQTQTIYGLPSSVFCRGNADTFVKAALVANRANLDLVLGLSDFDGDRENLPMDVVENSVELLSSIGFLEVSETEGQQLIALAASAKKMVVNNLVSFDPAP